MKWEFRERGERKERLRSEIKGLEEELKSEQDLTVRRRIEEEMAVRREKLRSLESQWPNFPGMG